MKTSENTELINTALAQARSEIKAPAKDSVNPYYGSRFASLLNVEDAILPALNKSGITIIQAPEFDNVGPLLTTRLIHQSGQYIESTVRLCVGKADAQGWMAALSYARRGCLQSLLCVCAMDDLDGEDAVNRSEPGQKRQGLSASAPQETLENHVAEDANRRASVNQIASLNEIYHGNISGLLFLLRTKNPALKSIDELRESVAEAMITRASDFMARAIMHTQELKANAGSDTIIANVKFSDTEDLDNRPI